MLAALVGLSGCAQTARQMLSQYQCEREADNRPDEFQRKAQCQLDATRGDLDRTSPDGAHQSAKTRD
ncbi:MAG: hypothetical protein Kow0020_13010 [Wenzhouxiangellaceae bacterium]